MIHITLPDGSIRSFEENLTVLDVAKDISEGFARNVISAKFNDTTVETSTYLPPMVTLPYILGKMMLEKKHFGIRLLTYLHKLLKNCFQV